MSRISLKKSKIFPQKNLSNGFDTGHPSCMSRILSIRFYFGHPVGVEYAGKKYGRMIQSELAGIVSD